MTVRDLVESGSLVLQFLYRRKGEDPSEARARSVVPIVYFEHRSSRYLVAWDLDGGPDGTGALRRYRVDRITDPSPQRSRYYEAAEIDPVQVAREIAILMTDLSKGAFWAMGRAARAALCTHPREHWRVSRGYGRVISFWCYYCNATIDEGPCDDCGKLIVPWCPEEDHPDLACDCGRYARC